MIKDRAAYVGFYKKIVFLFPALAVILAVSYYLAMKHDFDADIGHFTVDSLSFRIVIASVVISIAAAFIAALPSRKTVSIIDLPRTTIPSTFVSVFDAIISAVMLFDYVTDLTLGFTYTRFAQGAAILLPFLGVGLILSVFDRTAAGWPRLICFLLAALSVNLTMFSCYFDFTLPLNSPVRNLTLILQAAVLCQLLSEARLGMGALAIHVTPLFLVFSSAITSSITLGLSAGALINRCISGSVDDPNLSVDRLILYAVLGLLGLCRLFTIVPSLGDYDPTRKREKKKKKKKNKDENNEKTEGTTAAA